MPEECDDGNTNNNDGCDAGCLVEAGWDCQPNPNPPPASVCTPGCGNGTVEGLEQCDDNNQVNLDGCTSSCTNEDGRYGNPCIDNNDCLVEFECIPESAGPAGGYCSKLTCDLGSPNPTCQGPGACVPNLPGGGATACARTCTTDEECRWFEGYTCQLSNGVMVCLP